MLPGILLGLLTFTVFYVLLPGGIPNDYLGDEPEDAETFET